MRSGRRRRGRFVSNLRNHRLRSSAWRLFGVLVICSAGFSGCGGKNAPPVEVCDLNIHPTIVVLEGQSFVRVEELRMNCLVPSEGDKIVSREILDLKETYIASPLDETLDLWNYCKRKD